ncbi:EAL domain-containing protein [Tepidimonas sp.]|uniref:EAL domain-containing protein n=1 Tax=Tepidimonas sp. TaxID=2002775 RepID=UPI00391CB2B0
MAGRLARTMVDMAHALGMTAIAEGVETDEQRSLLQACGCDEIQGFLCSRPLEADAFVAFARANVRV